MGVREQHVKYAARRGGWAILFDYQMGIPAPGSIGSRTTRVQLNNISGGAVGAARAPSWVQLGSLAPSQQRVTMGHLSLVHGGFRGTFPGRGAARG